MNDLNSTSKNPLLQKIESRLIDFKNRKPLEYNELIRRYIVIDNSDKDFQPQNYSTTYKGCILIEYISNQDQAIHTLSIKNHQVKATNISIVVVYYEDPNTKLCNDELVHHIEYKSMYHKIMSLEYLINTLLTRSGAKIKYKRDVNFKKVIDLLKSDC